MYDKYYHTNIHMKKTLKLFCIISIIFVILIFSSVFAVEADVQINGEIIDFTDAEGNKVNAQIINSRTMVPLRKIFEVLGCEILWDGNTRTVTANKAGKEIILQINNNLAIINENGVEEKITLDTAPVILNNRTLVPLRFIAESLEKQVGWDNSTYTAIIIDYDYFADLIKQKNISLYNVLASSNDMSFSISRDYLNTFSNTPISNNATIKGNIIKNNDISNVTISFEGNNDLITDIKSEGWNSISYDAKYDKNIISIKTSNETFAKILNANVNEYNDFTIYQMGLIGEASDNLSGAIRSMFNIPESKLYVSTFNKMKVDFEKFLDLFIPNGTRNISYNNAELNVFDYTDFDNVIYQSEVSKVLSFINKKIFNYDFVQNEILYDWPKITYNMNSQNNAMVLKITLENEYNEKVSYTIEFKSI